MADCFVQQNPRPAPAQYHRHDAGRRIDGAQIQDRFPRRFPGKLQISLVVLEILQPDPAAAAAGSSGDGWCGRHPAGRSSRRSAPPRPPRASRPCPSPRGACRCGARGGCHVCLWWGTTGRSPEGARRRPWIAAGPCDLTWYRRTFPETPVSNLCPLVALVPAAGGCAFPTGSRCGAVSCRPPVQVSNSWSVLRRATRS